MLAPAASARCQEESHMVGPCYKGKADGTQPATDNRNNNTYFREDFGQDGNYGQDDYMVKLNTLVPSQGQYDGSIWRESLGYLEAEAIKDN